MTTTDAADGGWEDTATGCTCGWAPPEACPNDSHVAASKLETGCYVAGHWGQYGTARVIQIAEGYGYNDTEGIELAARHLAGGDLTDSEFDALTECGYDAENYLNDHVAGDGYLWGWHDGEFFYWTTATWEEAF